MLESLHNYIVNIIESVEIKSALFILFTGKKSAQIVATSSLVPRRKRETRNATNTATKGPTRIGNIRKATTGIGNIPTQTTPGLGNIPKPTTSLGNIPTATTKSGSDPYRKTLKIGNSAKVRTEVGNIRTANGNSRKRTTVIGNILIAATGETTGMSGATGPGRGSGTGPETGIPNAVRRNGKKIGVKERRVTEIERNAHLLLLWNGRDIFMPATSLGTTNL